MADRRDVIGRSKGLGIFGEIFVISRHDIRDDTMICYVVAGSFFAGFGVMSNGFVIANVMSDMPRRIPRSNIKPTSAILGRSSYSRRSRIEDSASRLHVA